MNDIIVESKNSIGHIEQLYFLKYIGVFNDENKLYDDVDLRIKKRQLFYNTLDSEEKICFLFSLLYQKKYSTIKWFLEEDKFFNDYKNTIIEYGESPDKKYSFSFLSFSLYYNLGNNFCTYLLKKYPEYKNFRLLKNDVQYDVINIAISKRNVSFVNKLLKHDFEFDKNNFEYACGYNLLSLLNKGLEFIHDKKLKYDFSEKCIYYKQVTYNLIDFCVERLSYDTLQLVIKFDTNKDYSIFNRHINNYSLSYYTKKQKTIMGNCLKLLYDNGYYNRDSLSEFIDKSIKDNKANLRKIIKNFMEDFNVDLFV